MAENLPLIPEKQDALCGDVQLVLRNVFRELDFLPPLVSEPLMRDDQKNEDGLQSQQWENKLSSEYRALYNQEEELKQEFAKRLAREPLPNIYKLHYPVYKIKEDWRQERGVIGREDLRPSIEQDAGRDTSLWIKSILNRSSGNLSEKKSELLRQFSAQPKANGDGSLQSLSLGELLPRPPPPPSLPVLPPPEPEYVLCVPPQLDFVNFTVGQLHTHKLRIVNITKCELRLSIRPPERREFDVELCSRLVVTSGAAAELRIHYRPRDVRETWDEINVRVSVGKPLKVPIHCYMEPPLLDVLLPNLFSRQRSVEDCYDITDVLDLGAKLLGDVHRTPLILHCDAGRAIFFLLPEDAWINFSVDVARNKDANIENIYGAASDSFWISPSHWAGGGNITGMAVCYASSHGVQTTMYRILCSTAIVRSLHLVADSLLFRLDHITIQAHEKDYDITSEDDRGCDCYVNLGIAFPNRSLAASIQIINHSPITYEYYWSMRRWGICSCWDATNSDDVGGEEELCPGAPKPGGYDEENELTSYDNVRAVHPEPAQGRLAPRCTSVVEVRVPDVGKKLGVQRAVMMLVLKNIPKESFFPDLDLMVIETDVIEEDSIPGVSPAWSREVCDIVCSQMEVWWEVTPVCFVVNQPLLIFPHSRRVKSITIPLEATQITGVECVTASWKIPDSDLPGIQLIPGQSILTNIQVPLRNLPDEYPERKIIQLVAHNDEWSATTRIKTGCSTRHPALRPTSVWLGLVPPAARVQAQITLSNETHQHIYWWGSSWRWWHENPVGAACAGRAACERCSQRTCTCALLKPSRGALEHGGHIELNYDVTAPESDGCVATLIQVRRTAADLAQLPARVGSEGRATLISYRVLAPKLMLQVFPCLGDKHGACEMCALDEGSKHGQRGTSVLRPSGALTLGRCACYRLTCTNLTPLPTTLRWQAPIEGEDTLKVTFIPNDIEVGAHAVVQLKVVVKPLKVCGRRIFVQRATVEYAQKPLYLLIDAAVKGLEVSVEVPVGGGERTDSSVIMRRTQQEEFLHGADSKKSLTIAECFAEHDKKRELQNDQWAPNVQDPGLAVQCSPPEGVMTSQGQVKIVVSVYADCWGLYQDQILIQIDKLEPIILDLWVEAVGPPLLFAINPTFEHNSPVLWMSPTDPDRILSVTNTSRADLSVQAFVIQEHGHPQDELPFRLYMRFYDVPPRTCPCCESLKSESVSEECTRSSEVREMDTAVELFLTADYGPQNYDVYQVEPESTIVPKLSNVVWKIRLLPTWDPVPSCVLLLRTAPVQKSGNNWYRVTTAPQHVWLRAVDRCPALQLSCPELRVSLCALDLPLDGVMRVRKSFKVQNVGTGHLTTSPATEPPWRVVARGGCSAGCGFGPRHRDDVTTLHLPPRTSVELCIELSLRTSELWPASNETYPPQRTTTTPLWFFDENNVMLLSIPLILEMDQPILQANPSSIDFGYVTDGVTRKMYITVTHSSPTATVELVTILEGSQDFQVWPPIFTLEPGSSARVYVQYTARWKSSPADGKLRVYSAGGAGHAGGPGVAGGAGGAGGGWCSALVAVGARVTLDHFCCPLPHDHTDDIPGTKPAQAPAARATEPSRAGKKKAAKRLPRVPKSAAVAVTVPEGSEITYAEVMKTAKAQIQLADLGIPSLRQKKAINGGLLLEIFGEDCAGKADALARKLQETVAEMGVRVARPTKQGEAWVMDLDDSVTQQNVANAIAGACGCIASDVRVREIRRRPSALGTAWVRCSLIAIHKLAAAKRLLVGWVSARVEVLPARSLQCFRCLEMGHARQKCTSTKDRSALCYVCGEPGHKASQCGAQWVFASEAKAPGHWSERDSGHGCRLNTGRWACASKRFVPLSNSESDGLLMDRSPSLKILQGNLNHCRGAQDLLQQRLVDCSVALAVVAEPYSVPEHPRWVGDDVQSVAVLAIYEEFLDRLARCVRSCLPRPVIVLGDSNAHSRAWGNRRDSVRGRATLEWASVLDLRLLNRGSCQKKMSGAHRLTKAKLFLKPRGNEQGGNPPPPRRAAPTPLTTQAGPRSHSNELTTPDTRVEVAPVKFTSKVQFAPVCNIGYKSIHDVVYVVKH
ncbi:uncharacterized protein [Epargyreus clarus]|uniref:uncharacterized protein n=1 Tax=Epargyreus clarus TaxID=520877 RepID=UPI003C2F08F5